MELQPLPKIEVVKKALEIVKQIDALRRYKRKLLQPSARANIKWSFYGEGDYQRHTLTMSKRMLVSIIDLEIEELQKDLAKEGFKEDAE